MEESDLFAELSVHLISCKISPISECRICSAVYGAEGRRPDALIRARFNDLKFDPEVSSGPDWGKNEGHG